MYDIHTCICTCIYFPVIALFTMVQVHIYVCCSALNFIVMRLSPEMLSKGSSIATTASDNSSEQTSGSDNS